MKRVVSECRHPHATGDPGSSLIILIGIVAALSLLAVALVAVLANAQHATSRDKARTTAFDIAEAAVDVTMQSLSESWPDDTHPWTPTTFATVAPTFGTTFGVTPNATSGNAVWVSVLDDSGADISAAPTYDDNANGYVWVDAQAQVNGVASRVRAMVQAKFYEMNLPKGVVVCAEDDLNSNAATGNTASGKHKIGAGDVSIGGQQPVAMAIWGTIQNPEVAWPYVDQDPPSKPHASDLIPPDLITDLRAIAESTGKLFTAGALPSTDDFTGLCVVEAGAGVTIQLGQNGKTDAYNSPANPGILLVLGGAELKLAGNTEYYGVIYTEGNIGVAQGNPIIYGMLVTQGGFDMGGVAQVIYREDCLVNLNRQFQTSTRLVPSYWRELTPVVHTAP